MENEIVYVVTCYMEGCEDCGNNYHVVGVFKDEKKAEEARKEHERNKENHLHWFNTNIESHTIQR